MAPQKEALDKFEQDHPGAKVTFPIQDQRAMIGLESDSSKIEELVKLTPAEQRNRNRQHNMFTKFVDAAMARNDAEIRCDPSKRREEQIINYGPDHEIIHVKSPDEPPGTNVLGDADEQDDEVKDVTPQSHEERLAAVRRENEACKVSILSSMQLPVWMKGLSRINKFELVYARCPMDKMTTVEGLKDIVWSWLTRHQEVTREVFPQTP